MENSDNTRNARGRKTLLAILVVAVMVATSFAVIGQVLQHSRAQMLSEVPLQWQQYVNAAIDRGDIAKDASPQMVKDWLANRMTGLSDKVKTSWVNPAAAKDLAEREAKLGTGVQEPPAVTGTGKILVLLVEFTGSDTYKGVTYTGPMHNQIPQPPPEDNVDYWISDFNTQHYIDMLFGSSGLTLANYYKEQSGGVFTVGGFVTAWVQINHSEWYYGADSRTGGEGSDDLNGPVWRLPIDAAAAAYQQYGNAIPWAEFDADGNGWIDSLMVIRAGADQSAGAPSWTVWAHSWFANYPDGYQIAPGLPKVGSYTTEPENEAIGVYAHEYGHQLGLPDEYDTTYLGESPVGFLSLMASGSWGPGALPDGRMVLGLMPCDLSVWDKYVLGWENGATAYLNYDGSNAVSKIVSLSQVEGSKGVRAIKVELPKQAVPLPLPTPKSGTYQWYSGYKPDVADVMAGSDHSEYRLTSAVPITIPASGAKLTFYEWYDLEPYYDFAFVQASSDDGATWTSLAGRYTTNANPNGGNPGNGLTGAAKHYVPETMDLSAFAGKNILLRFMLTQDGGVFGLGWTLDDIAVAGIDGTIVFQDLVAPDSTSKWVKSATDELGPGWSISTATAGGNFRQYYIMEWRNFVGFDKTLSTSYQYVGNYVQFWSHTPGLMIWYRNFAMGDNTVGYHPGQVAIGIVDAHPAPLLMADGHYVRQRIQLMDSAFGLRPTVANTITLLGVPTTFPSLPAAKTFDDSKQFFYYQVKGSSVDYEGLMLPTLGVHATVLTEKAGLTGAAVYVSASPIV